MPEARPPVSVALAELGVEHQLFYHEGEVRSLEQAAAERGQRPQQIVRSLLFRLEEGRYAMVLMAGPGQVAWPALRQHFGRSRLTMASADEVLSVTGYPLGAVAPFGLPHAAEIVVEIVVDQSVLAEDEVSLGSGVRGVAIVLETPALIAALEKLVAPQPLPMVNFAANLGD